MRVNKDCLISTWFRRKINPPKSISFKYNHVKFFLPIFYKFNLFLCDMLYCKYLVVMLFYFVELYLGLIDNKLNCD